MPLQELTRRISPLHCGDVSITAVGYVGWHPRLPRTNVRICILKTATMWKLAGTALGQEAVGTAPHDVARAHNFVKQGRLFGSGSK